MSVPIIDQARRVLDALDEGGVGVVITLYEKGMLGAWPNSVSKREDIRHILTSERWGLKMTDESADYWLDWFNVK